MLATYYRNNILHLFAMPSLIACGFISNARMRTADLQRLVWRVYPYIGAELFLRWDETQIGAVVDSLLDAFVALRPASGQRGPRRVAASAAHLSRSRQAVAARASNPPNLGTLLSGGRAAAAGGFGNHAAGGSSKQRCHLMAQRMSVLYGLNSPEFFDKSLFRNFIDLLRRRGVVQVSDAGTLVFGEALLGVARDAQWVLSEQIRHSILQVSLGQVAGQ